ncbi:NADPH-dependent ferric siderophore reductase [Lysinibacter cavernae]|uniref:NADPH-dependent ferric siderophore reductase n=1 Tax=Lysinibacter cavernae TaxID=1640652 RepID=A0A7X5TU70_9MICO|nr:NADPH-dependent ferric siderophore reductase [Lysinibacter cavernae]
MTDTILSVTLTGEDLDGFVSAGPTDHIKLFLPDPATGILNAPWLTEDGAIQRPDTGVSISRDYTPLRFVAATADSLATLDIEFVLHENPGPATVWAQGAAVDDEVVVAGPRGSVCAPSDAARAILIADESALPAATRWLELLPASTRVTIIAQGEDDSIDAYFSADQRARASIEWLYREDGPGQLLEAVRSLDFDADTFVWAAGEASELIPVRRYLRATLAALQASSPAVAAAAPADISAAPAAQPSASSPAASPAAQLATRLSVQGYWKRGVVNLDHHAPLDESDPD